MQVNTDETYSIRKMVSEGRNSFARKSVCISADYARRTCPGHAWSNIAREQRRLYNNGHTFIYVFFFVCRQTYTRDGFRTARGNFNMLTADMIF